MVVGVVKVGAVKRVVSNFNTSKWFSSIQIVDGNAVKTFCSTGIDGRVGHVNQVVSDFYVHYPIADIWLHVNRYYARPTCLAGRFDRVINHLNIGGVDYRQVLRSNRGEEVLGNDYVVGVITKGLSRHPFECQSCACRRASCWLRCNCGSCRARQFAMRNQNPAARP